MLIPTIMAVPVLEMPVRLVSLATRLDLLELEQMVSQSDHADLSAELTLHCVRCQPIGTPNQSIGTKHTLLTPRSSPRRLQTPIWPRLIPSLDAIHPRPRCGTYAGDNRRLLDIGCNFVKLGLTADEATVLLRHSGAERVLDVDESGILCPPTRSQVDKETMSTAVVKAWAEAWAKRTVRLLR
jgi:hypothetical protein